MGVDIPDRYEAPEVDEGLVSDVASLVLRKVPLPWGQVVVARRQETVAAVLGVVGEVKIVVVEDGADLARILSEIRRSAVGTVFVTPGELVLGSLVGIDEALAPWRRAEGESVHDLRALMPILQRVMAEYGMDAAMRKRMMRALLHDGPGALRKSILYAISSGEDPEVLAVDSMVRALARKGLEGVDFGAFLEAMEYVVAGGRQAFRIDMRVERNPMIKRGLEIMARLCYVIVKPVGDEVYDVALNSNLLVLAAKNPEVMALLRHAMVDLREVSSSAS